MAFSAIRDTTIQCIDVKLINNMLNYLILLSLKCLVFDLELSTSEGIGSN